MDYKQRQDIQNFCDLYPFPLKEQILNRNKLSLEFIKSYPDKVKRKNFIHQLFSNYESIRESSYAKAINENEQKYYELLVVILNSLNFEQRKYLTKILKDRIEQVSKISEKTKSELY